MESNAASPYRELAYRASDGIDVVLLWHPGPDEPLVSVSDQRSGEQAVPDLCEAPTR